MANVICLHTKETVEAFCRSNPFLHIYSIGDLDDFFWPHTTWYALQEQRRIQQIVLLYADLSMRMPTVLALAEEPADLMRDLLRAILPLLPRRFHAHLDQRAADILASDYRIAPHGTFHKMGLIDRSRLGSFDTSEVLRLSAADLADLRARYAAGYEDNWFVPRMLDTDFYFGVRRGHALASVAGVHVYSRRYGVAALGNITTRPDMRGQGLATAVSSRLCLELLLFTAVGEFKHGAVDLTEGCLIAGRRQVYCVV